MWSDELNLDLKKKVQFVGTALGRDEASEGGTIGGFFKNGTFGWRASESKIEIFYMKSGKKIARHNFDENAKTKNCLVSCVHEIYVSELKTSLLAVGLQLQGNNGLVCVFSVQGARVIGQIEIGDKITCLHFISKDTCNRGVLNQYKECIAVGTENGKVMLIDLCLHTVEDDIFGKRIHMNKSETRQCHIEFSNVEPSKIIRNHKHVQEEGIYFGLQLEIIDTESPVLSLLEIELSMALVVGLADGRMIFYDLTDLHAFHLAHPPTENTPLLNLTYLEPTDDPKACLYVWAFHAGSESAFAVMHTIMYEDKFTEQDGHIYENFISCNPRLTMSCFDKGSIPIACQSISKAANQQEEVLTLCMLSWITSRKMTNVLVFDLNQWYREEMPELSDWRIEPNHLVVFPIKESETLNVFFELDSLVQFNSIQRPEEHFYPEALSFEIKTMNLSSCHYYQWAGLQNKAIEYFEQCGPTGILEPTQCYNILMNAALIPQFCDYVLNSDTSIDVQREFLLSLALEYNCFNLLKNCALQWADGSCSGSDPQQGLSLSTLTDWIWSRARALKDISNSLCVPLFDHSGRRIDRGTQNRLSHCSKQLNYLSELFELIITKLRQYIPDRVYKQLKSQCASVGMASGYQEVLQWLLNVGLLPEGDTDSVSLSDEFVLVPFPYERINSFYKSQRAKLYDEDEDKCDRTLPIDEQCSQFLFIDAFIERECQSDALGKMWIENNGSGVYPPSSMQNVLRTLLVPNVSLENKYILLIYVFMDIHATINEGRYADIVQNLIKFPAVFKINPAVIKRTQAFWFLDRGHLEAAIEELISPLSHNQHLCQWQREFLIATLLRQDVPNLALRALYAPGLAISPFLEMKTLLSNNLIAEAFKLQRSKRDPELLKYFYEIVLRLFDPEILLELALTEEEGLFLRDYLQTASHPLAANLNFIYLLQRSHFIEAVQMIESMSRKKNEYNLDVPREVLSIYHSTMEPTTRHLSYMACTDKKDYSPRNKPEFIEPLSTSLIKNRGDFRNGLYKKTINSIKDASDKIEHSQPFLEKPGFGIFGRRTETQSNDICYPIILNNKSNKRRINEEVSLIKPRDADVFSEYEQPTKRRRVENQSFRDLPKSVLTNFKEMKPSFNFSFRTEPSLKKQTPEKAISRSPIVQLTTPLIKKRKMDEESSPTGRQTPHSILKASSSIHSLSRRSVSPAPVSIFLTKPSDFEEKSIRFNIPDSPSPTAEETLQASAFTEQIDFSSPNCNTSYLSNDEFFSPEGSITMEVESINDYSTTAIKDLHLSVPKARKPIRSRSNTPTECNIAILIEDVEDDVPKADSERGDPEIIEVGNGNKDEEEFSNKREANSQSRETRSRSKTPEGKISSRSFPKPRKSLGRMVLEKSVKMAADIKDDSVLDTSADSIIEESQKDFLVDNSDVDESWLKRNQLNQSTSTSCNDSSMNILEKTHFLTDRSDSEDAEGSGSDSSDSEDSSSSYDILKKSHFLSDSTDSGPEFGYEVEKEKAAVLELDDTVEGSSFELGSEGDDEIEGEAEEDNDEEGEEEEDNEDEAAEADEEVINISSSEEDEEQGDSRNVEVQVELHKEQPELEEEEESESENDNLIINESTDEENEDIVIELQENEITNEIEMIYHDKEIKVVEVSTDDKLNFANIYSGDDCGEMPELILEQDQQCYMGDIDELNPVQVLECDTSHGKTSVSNNESNSGQNVALIQATISAELSVIEPPEKEADFSEVGPHDAGILDTTDLHVAEEVVENAEPQSFDDASFDNTGKSPLDIAILESCADVDAEAENTEANIAESSSKTTEAKVAAIKPDRPAEIDVAETDDTEEDPHNIGILESTELKGLADEYEQEKGAIGNIIKEVLPEHVEEKASVEIDDQEVVKESEEIAEDLSFAYEDALSDQEMQPSSSTSQQNVEIPTEQEPSSSVGDENNAVKNLSLSQTDDAAVVVPESHSPTKLREEVSNYENERELKRALSAPKKAHEMDAPIINLSVKPDEAHEANRKNKNDIPLAEDPALNLTTSQCVESTDDEEMQLRIDEDESEENVPLTPSRYNFRTFRARSVSIDKLDSPSLRKITKATSVPTLLQSEKDVGSPRTPTKRRRASLDVDPSNVIKSKMIMALEKIDEDSQSTDKEIEKPNQTKVFEEFPKISRKGRRPSIDAEIAGPSGAVKAKQTPPDEANSPKTLVTRPRRLSSAESFGTPEVGTPRRTTRASSISRDTIEVTTPRRPSVDAEVAGPSSAIKPKPTPPDEANTHKTPVTRARRLSSAESSGTPEVGTTRRTTRASSISRETIEVTTPRKRKFSEKSIVDEENVVDEDDKKSVKSVGSSKSAKVKKSKTTPKEPVIEEEKAEEDDEKKSVKSVGSSKSANNKKSKITPKETVIQEEEAGDDEKKSVKSVGSSKSAKVKKSKTTPKEPVIEEEEAEDDENKSVKSVESSKSAKGKKLKLVPKEPIIEEEETERVSPKQKAETSKMGLFEEYTTSRRLTRNQSAVIEKSLQLAQKYKIGEKSSTEDRKPHDDDHSEPESIVSNASAGSKQSKASRTKRTKKRSIANESDSASVVSSIGTDQSESPVKKTLLEVIPEEPENDGSSSIKSKVGKPKRRTTKK